MKVNPQGGCLAKIPATRLTQLLEGSFGAARSFGTALGVPNRIHPMISPEDCAIIDQPTGKLLATTEVLAPIVSDAEVGGRIAAFHAMSDIFASGGTPKWALIGLVVDVEQQLDDAIRVLTGVLQACAEENVELIGGHTTFGIESLLSITVLGTCQGKRLLRKRGAQHGDHLFLSRAVGSGIVVRAFSCGKVDVNIFQHILSLMDRSNSKTATVAQSASPHAATDVSGFGLVGHLCQMLGPGQGAELKYSAIPIHEAARNLDPQFYEGECIAGNYKYATSSRPIMTEIVWPQLAILFDPQTNGGLLVAADAAYTPLLEAGGFTHIGAVINSERIEVGP